MVFDLVGYRTDPWRFLAGACLVLTFACSRSGLYSFADTGDAPLGGAGRVGNAGNAGGVTGVGGMMSNGGGGKAGVLGMAGRPSVCGNGVLEPGEACDDGNSDQSDSCLLGCVTNVCGDGFPLVGSQGCDDHNLTSGDGCSSLCTTEPVVLVSGRTSLCAWNFNGMLKCWGGNNGGELGLGDVNPRGDGPNEMGSALPAVSLPASVVEVGIGVRNACARSLDALRCWGGNDAGQSAFGDQHSRGDQPGEMGTNLPTLAFGAGVSVMQFALGDYHGCALLNDESVKCWGQNAEGQLGLGDTAPRGDQPGEMGDALPRVDLGPGTRITRIEAGGSHTCVMREDGSIQCWGANGSGQLGVGDRRDRGSLTGDMGAALGSVDLGTGRYALDLALGAAFSCAVLDDFSAKCWGANGAGELGQGDTENRGDDPEELGDNLRAVDFGVAQSVLAVAPGGNHACAMLKDHSVKCWGENAHGELGLGDTVHRGDDSFEMGDYLGFVDLGQNRSARIVVAGERHSCALLDDGTVKCWGGAFPEGQLGLGDTSNRGDEPGEMGDALPPVPLVF